MSAVTSPPDRSSEQRVILDNISWATYLRILEEAGNCRGRICYDRGVLEIMSPSRLHEKIKSLILQMIRIFALELNIEIDSAGSTTLKRERLERGFEADETFWIAHADAVRGRKDVDLDVDPPPDLVVEVDISRSSMGKLGLFAAFGVPEVWRYDGNDLRISILRGEGYTEVKESSALPRFPVAEAVRVLEECASRGETSLVRSFRDYVRKNIGTS